MTMTMFMLNGNLYLELSFPFRCRLQARRQKFPEGGSSTRVALTAGGSGAAQGPQKLWGIWSKILQSSNFQALHSNFRKVLFLKLII